MNSEIGLVLSGGGVRGIAHVGFLQVLLENNIIPTKVSGTSAGALVCALYAAGYNTQEMLAFFKETPLLKLSLYALNKPGIMDSEKYIEFFKRYFSEDTFESLKIPLTVTATNLLNGQLDYFNKGQLIKPLIASCALPPVFSPIEVNGSLYSDGGVLNNFPIEPLKASCSKILGSFVNPIEEIAKTEINSSLKLMYRVYHIGLDASNIKKFSECNYVFSPRNIDEVGVLDADGIDKAYKIGYDNAQNEIERILKAVNY
ncbi:patatin-like phospholipase family protein [Lutibacter sp. A80]|uniref:patatin-like phospholipase family protein n=1 Tax=Lutibacter sp. A80 TaxID=2918453 RepID=UPI001F058E6D|nr:patatin-like phospholipase family protein [Lutibacter sp. A80]UMB59743.1 patatin-like phospholipase family protein [Lutibacter sp. A80]